MSTHEQLREAVRRRYAAAATGVTGCCGSGGHSCQDPITRDLYEDHDIQTLPATAVQASLGCGNPTALAELRPGEDVLDLGSGGGIDVLLSARRVGPEGKAYGLDMTDEMLQLARRNQREAGVTNVEFMKGHIEDIPLPADSVDVVISNCVINLSIDKSRVLQETFRVLRPGGRFAVTDIVFQGTMPEEVRRNIELWTGCVAGALGDIEYRETLAAAGFVDIDVEIIRAYDNEELCGLSADPDAVAGLTGAGEDGRFASAFVRARKPAKP